LIPVDGPPVYSVIFGADFPEPDSSPPTAKFEDFFKGCHFGNLLFWDTSSIDQKHTLFVEPSIFGESLGL